MPTRLSCSTRPPKSQSLRATSLNLASPPVTALIVHVSTTGTVLPVTGTPPTPTKLCFPASSSASFFIPLRSVPPLFRLLLLSLSHVLVTVPRVPIQEITRRALPSLSPFPASKTDTSSRYRLITHSFASTHSLPTPPTYPTQQPWSTSSPLSSLLPPCSLSRLVRSRPRSALFPSVRELNPVS